MAVTTHITATTLGDAARAEDGAEPTLPLAGLLGGLARLVPLVLGLVRVFAWIWVAVGVVNSILSTVDWIGGQASAGKDALMFAAIMVAAVVVALGSGRLIGWLHTFADRAERAPALVRQRTLATGIVDHLIDGSLAGQTCDYRRQLRSLHGWVDDGGHRGSSYTWLAITTPWHGEELSITVDLEFSVANCAVHLEETWRFRGPLTDDVEQARRHLGDVYDLEVVTDSEVVLRHYQSVRQHHSRGTTSTPWSTGGDLDDEVLLGAIPLLLSPTGCPA